MLSGWQMFYSPGAFSGISQGHETEAEEIELLCSLSPLFSKVVLQLISPVILSSVRRDMHFLTSLTTVLYTFTVL